MGGISLTQGSNGFFDLANGRTINVDSGVFCPHSVGNPFAHFSAPANVVPPGVRSSKSSSLDEARGLYRVVIGCNHLYAPRRKEFTEESRLDVIIFKAPPGSRADSDGGRTFDG